jgi:hypothetical protein|nr:MAG TPA: hypothetical protein [Caudoviricetes sp.]
MNEIEKIKQELNVLAEKDFYLEMVDRWEERHYKLSQEYHKGIKELIKELEEYGITTEYNLGYEFEYRRI